MRPGRPVKDKKQHCTPLEVCLSRLLKSRFSVIDASGGKVGGVECNEGGVAELLITCQEGIHILAVYFWHTERWSVRDEARF